MFFQIPTVWGPWRVLDLPDRITYSHTQSNAKLFPHTIHCVKPPQKIKLWSLRPSYQVLYPCPKSLAATIDGGLTAKEAEQVSCLSSPPSIHITHTHTCRRTHSRPLQSVLSSYPDPQLPVLANRRRFKFHSVKKLAHCYSVTGRANDVRQWQRWTPLSLWCLVAIAGPLLRRHRNAGDWQRRWWQQRLRERLTASVKCPVCVCAGVCVPLQACFDTRHLLSDGKLHAWLRWTLMPALRPFCPRGSQRGAVLRNLSTTDTWVDGDLCLLSATFFFFFGCSHKGHCSELKEPPSSFFLRFFLWTVQHVAAISTRTSPTINRITETTLVCGRSLYVYVTPVPATPITNEMIPNGKMQRYQDFSIPPVACDSLSRDDSTSGTLGAPSCGWPSRVGGAVVCGWQVKCPVVHPILRLDAGNTTIKMRSVWARRSGRKGNLGNETWRSTHNVCGFVSATALCLSSPQQHIEHSSRQNEHCYICGQKEGWSRAAEGAGWISWLVAAALWRKMSVRHETGQQSTNRKEVGEEGLS